MTGIVPNQTDVLLGKGTAINSHPGNEHFRTLVESYKPKFSQTPREKKRGLASEIINEIHKSGGRFLVEDPNSSDTNHYGDGITSVNNCYSYQVHPCILAKVWICVDHDKAVGKVMSRLREKKSGAAGRKQKPQPTETKQKQSSIQSEQGCSLVQTSGCDLENKAVANNALLLNEVPSGEGGVDSQQQINQQANSEHKYNDATASYQYDAQDQPTIEEPLKQPLPATLPSEIMSTANIIHTLHIAEPENPSDSATTLIDHKSTEAAAEGTQHNKSIQSHPTEQELLTNFGNNGDSESSGKMNAPVPPRECLSGDSPRSNAPKSGGKISSHTSNNKKNSKMLSGIDEELTTFLQGLSSYPDADPIEHIHEEEGTMRQWIERSRSKQTASILDYVKSALPIALKMTSCLIEAEKDEKMSGTNPIPVASIAAANVLVRAKEVYLIDESDNPQQDRPTTDQKEEVIDYVSIMSCVGDDPDAGGVMPRLYALGIALFELFSGQEPPAPNSESPITLNSINLDNIEEGSRNTRKKLQRSDGITSKCISILNFMGMPQSICALIGNLLDCGKGDTRSDDAYSSYTDVFSDLQLMFDDPLCFLNDIVVNPLPSLLICNKLCGREDEICQLEKLYQENVDGIWGGVILAGKAGVGKSKVALHVQTLSNKMDGYFLSAKFDQTQDVFPLATIGTLFNSLCDLFARDATDAQLKAVNESLKVALGGQAVLLVGIIPSLLKISPSCSRTGESSCIDASMSMQYLFSELLRVLSSHSRRISFFLDDLQWADPISLLLLSSLISSNEQLKASFFICSYRDDEVNENEPFHQWLSSTLACSFETIKLDNISVDGANQLISHTLHLSPRITLPLSSVLHQKSGGGNPLFLKQIIDSLKEKGYIYVDLSFPKWSWDMDKIMELKICDDVVSLLLEEMQKLDDDLQFGLKVASCIGSSVNHTTLDILSQDYGRDLQDILQKISQKGFLNVIDGADGTTFCFSHDKIQQASYQLFSAKERRNHHMRIGLSICSHTLNADTNHDQLFFLSINQINRGGRDAISNPNQRVMVAQLNLKAGNRSIELSDINNAFFLFKNGISFLDGDHHWDTDYELCMKLYDAACDAACVIGNETAVNLLAKEIFAHSRSSDDKLNGMHAVTKSLSNEGLQKEAIESSFKILLMAGESLPRRMGDDNLQADVGDMNNTLKNLTDDEILKMDKSDHHKFDTLMKIYRLLGNSFKHFDPSRDISLRMVQITLNNGLFPTSPVGFAYYGETLVGIGKIDLGVRLGRLALKLAEKTSLQKHKPQVICGVYQSILLSSTPLQSIADAHITGYKAGQQLGDIVAATMNYSYFLSTSYITGQHLNKLRDDLRRLVLKMLKDNNVIVVNHLVIFHSHCSSLMEGVHMLDQESIDDIPGVKSILANPQTKKDATFGLVNKIHWLVRIYLFRQFDDPSVGHIGFLSDLLSEKKIQLWSLILIGIFLEGLAAFQLARHTQNQDSLKWITKGESVLSNMQRWNEHCPWNFENKMALLEAEKMSILGEYDKAELLYLSSIKSAKEHKFVHEEAIGSELLGQFFHERGCQEISHSYFMHSIKCYKKWGALAVARRVEDTVQSIFGSYHIQMKSAVDSPPLELSTREGSSKKHSRS